ncbi:MAG TPA: hypothetical protein VN903_23700 [Polyangia bacterium]|jgi:hypothetical protein|nr:hypothetical protein [Polyangia bacterium]
MMKRETALQLLLVGAAAVLALAVNHFFFHWVLFTELPARRVMY